MCGSNKTSGTDTTQQPQYLERGDVGGDGNKLGLLLLDQGRDVVQAELEDGSGSARLGSRAGGLGLTSGGDAGVLLSLSLWGVPGRRRRRDVA